MLVKWVGLTQDFVKKTKDYLNTHEQLEIDVTHKNVEAYVKKCDAI